MFASSEGDLGNRFSLGSEAESLGPHAFVGARLRGQGCSGGAGHEAADLADSGAGEEEVSRGVFRALRKRFTAGDTIRLARDTIPKGRIISEPW